MTEFDPASADQPIVEGIVTTLNEDASPNIAPMGPRVDRDFRRFILRPFTSSTTYRNLKRTKQGVFHVVDDVALLAHAAVGELNPLPQMSPATHINGVVLDSACRWYELRVDNLDDRAERTTIGCSVVAGGAIRDFFGFNRAKHAVVEAAILATRIGILPDEEIRSELKRLESPVAKTAGLQEREAFAFLKGYIEQRLVQPK